MTAYYRVICEFTDVERGVEETTTLAYAALNDLEYECEIQAMALGDRYNSMPRKRGKHRWEIREPGELIVIVRAQKEQPD